MFNNRIYLLQNFHEGTVHKIVIIPYGITIEFLIRKFLLENYEPYVVYLGTGKRRRIIQTFWVDEEVSTAVVNRYSAVKLDKNDLDPEVKFTIERNNVELFIPFLLEQGCLVLDPEYIP